MPLESKTNTNVINFNMIFDAKKYKEAKVFAQEIRDILLIINITIPILNKYKKYTAVKHVINSMLDAKSQLSNHLKRQTEIVRTKGKVNVEKEPPVSV